MIKLEIRDRGMMSLCATEEKTTVVVVASYRSVSSNPVRLKTLVVTLQTVAAFIHVSARCENEANNHHYNFIISQL